METADLCRKVDAIGRLAGDLLDALYTGGTEAAPAAAPIAAKCRTRALDVANAISGLAIEIEPLAGDSSIDLEPFEELADEVGAAFPDLRVAVPWRENQHVTARATFELIPGGDSED